LFFELSQPNSQITHFLLTATSGHAMVVKVRL